MDGVDDLGAIDALQVNRRDPEMGMPQLALDNDQRDALVSHLDGVSVAKLMRREPTTDAGEHCGAVQLLASGGLLPVPPSGWAVDHAQQRSGTKPGAQLEPRLKLCLIPTSE